MSSITTNSLSKTYGSVKAVDGIDLNVKSGQIFGFLGPNGAGKSTTIAILFQFLKQDSGNVQVFDLDTKKS